MKPETPSPIGYAIGVDTYFKREDTGIIYQMNVAPGSQRGYVGATLLKAMFDRWPYGVRLCCCWCAQDLGANHFWEAMGFVPLAFRAGSRKRDRIHIFWQKAIRDEDRDGAADNFRGWWFPSQTGAGALKEDRIVLPIPPGTHWSDAKPRVLPAESGVAALMDEAAAARKMLTAASHGPVDKEARKRERAAKKAAQAEVVKRAKTVAAGGLRFGAAPSEKAKQGAAEKKERTKRTIKNDPRLVAAARELRDRWLEQVAAQPGLIEAASGGGKYAVGGRVGSGAARIEGGQTIKLLPEAA